MEHADVSEKFLIYLKRYHTGEGRAVQSLCLENRFHLSGRKIRDIVNVFRCEGIPICSDENGYYYAANAKEVIRSISQLDSRIRKIEEAKIGLEGALPFFPGSSCQMQLKVWVVHIKGDGQILTVL